MSSVDLPMINVVNSKFCQNFRKNNNVKNYETMGCVVTPSEFFLHTGVMILTTPPFFSEWDPPFINFDFVCNLIILKVIMFDILAYLIKKTTYLKNKNN